MEKMKLTNNSNDTNVERPQLRSEIQISPREDGSFEVQSSVEGEAKREVRVDETVDAIEIRKELVDFGHEKSKEERSIDTVVVHTLYNDAFEGDERFDMANIIAILRQHGFAPHYVVGRAGEILQMVEENDVAWHAGKSELPEDPQRGKVNPFSLGIELVNAEDTEITDEQYRSLANLVAQKVKEGHARTIVSHATIAPERKTNPWNFDWALFGKLLADKLK